MWTLQIENGLIWSFWALALEIITSVEHYCSLSNCQCYNCQICALRSLKFCCGAVAAPTNDLIRSSNKMNKKICHQEFGITPSEALQDMTTTHQTVM